MKLKYKITPSPSKNLTLEENKNIRTHDYK
jgi:hypothetical protein